MSAAFGFKESSVELKQEGLLTTPCCWMMGLVLARRKGARPSGLDWQSIYNQPEKGDPYFTSQLVYRLRGSNHFLEVDFCPFCGQAIKPKPRQ